MIHFDFIKLGIGALVLLAMVVLLHEDRRDLDAGRCLTGSVVALFSPCNTKPRKDWP